MNVPLALTGLALEGWLYLARPLLTALVLLFAFAMWRWDRLEFHPRPRRAGPRPTAWYLEVVEPGPARSLARGTRIPVDSRLTLGRSGDCAVVVDDPAVSALHAVVSLQDGGCHVEDLGSRNGTLVLAPGQSAPTPASLLSAPHTLTAGETIVLGDVRLRVGRESGR